MNISVRTREVIDEIAKRRVNTHCGYTHGMNILNKMVYGNAYYKNSRVYDTYESYEDNFRNELIHNATDSELKFKEYLDGKSFGYEFQKVIYVNIDGKRKFFIADFYFKKYNLIVELDGCYHYSEEQNERDIKRTDALQKHGYHVMRFDNSRTDDCMSILIDILSFIKSKNINV